MKLSKESCVEGESGETGVQGFRMEERSDTNEVGGEWRSTAKEKR